MWRSVVDTVLYRRCSLLFSLVFAQQRTAYYVVTSYTVRTIHTCLVQRQKSLKCGIQHFLFFVAFSQIVPRR